MGVFQTPVFRLYIPPLISNSSQAVHDKASLFVVSLWLLYRTKLTHPESYRTRCAVSGHVQKIHIMLNAVNQFWPKDKLIELL